MTDQGPDIIPGAVLEEAATWHARLASGDVKDADIERHMEWLLEDPVHTDAYEAVCAAALNVGAFEDDLRTRFADDFEQARKSGKSWFDALFGGWGWPQGATAVAAAAALLFFAVMPVLNPVGMGQGPQEYASEGQVRLVTLADGSRMSLFAGAQATVTLKPDSRVVALKSGRAFFDVTSNKERPFYVRTASREVKVVGTRFEVAHTGGRDRVAVNEGLVAVSGHDTAAAPLMIEPGTVAQYEAGQNVPEITHVAPNLIGMWSEGVLAFRQASLADVLEKIHTIFPDQLVDLADPAMAQLEFSGTLVVSEAEQMVRQLAAFLDLKVIVTDTGFVLSRQ